MLVTSKLLICVIQIFFLTFIDQSWASFIRLEDDGGYQDIVIAVSPSIDEDKGYDLINKTTELFRKTSDLLFKATSKGSHPLHINFITFLVSPKWTSITNQSTYQTYQRADVRLVEDPEHGEYPPIYTEQVGGCGQPGEYVQLTPSFVNKDNQEIQARSLLQQWARYRYGVFPEESNNSSLYPKQYRDENGVQLTGCTYPNLWKKTCEDEVIGKCTFEFEHSAVLETSLMDDATLPTQYFCEELSHNKNAPTMHNILCGRRSIWEILQLHADFNRSFATPSTLELNTKIIRAKEIQAVLVVDHQLCLSGNGDSGISETVRLAIVSFLNNMFPQTQVGVIFSQVMEKSELLVGAHEISANTWLERCSLAPAQPNGTSPDIHTAIHDAAQFLQNYFTSGQGGVLILFAKPSTLEELKDLMASLNKQNNEKGINTFLITYTPLKINESDNKIIQTSTSNTKWFNIMPEVGCSLEAWKKIHDVLHDIIGQYVMDFHPKSTITLSNQTEWRFSSRSSSKAVVTAHYCNPNTTLNIDNANYTTTNPETRTTTTTLLLKEGSTLKVDNPAFITIVEELPASSVTSISVRVEQTQDEKKPVIVRASIKTGNEAVQNARVYAILTSLEDDNSWTFCLLDTGNGDPDIFSGDGVYSRYIMPEKSGMYQLVLGLGSETQPFTHDPTNYTGVDGLPLRISRSVGTYFFSAMNPDYPPNQIRDFRLESLSQDMRIVQFAWTAPGNNFDHGNASKYELKCSTDDKSVADKDSFSQLVFESTGLQIPTPADAGATQTLYWTIPKDSMYSGKFLFCAIQAQNAKEKPNIPSNIAAFQISEAFPETTTLQATSPATDSTDTSLQPQTNITQESSTKPEDIAISKNQILETLRVTRDAVIGGTVIIILLLLVIIGLMLYLKWGHRMFGRKQADQGDTINLQNNAATPRLYTPEPNAAALSQRPSPLSPRTSGQIPATPRENAKSSSKTPAKASAQSSPRTKPFLLFPGQKADKNDTSLKLPGQQLSTQASFNKPRSSGRVASGSANQDNIYIDMEKPPSDTRRAASSSDHADEVEEHIYDDVAQA